MPSEDIPEDNFSVIAYGYLKPPISDKYKFTVITSGAVELTINNVAFLNHYTTNFKKGWKGAEYGDKVISDEAQLQAGTLYEYQLKFWRSDHQRFIQNSFSYAHVRW